MKEYTNIGFFTYKNTKYILLLDEKRKYFFLKENEFNEYEYLTLKEILQLTLKFGYNPNVLLVDEKGNKKRMLLKPMLIIGTTLTLLTGTITGIVNTYNKSQIDFSNTISTSQSVDYTQTNSNTPNIVYVDESKTDEAVRLMMERIEENMENFEVETSTEGFHLTIVYDSSALDDFLGPKEAITYDTLRETLNQNSHITGQYKQKYLDLINNMERDYPTMDLRVWNQNLKTLQIHEVTEMQMKQKALSVNAAACYRKDENAIYTVKGYNYEKGIWDYQVMIHEMCHPIRTISMQVNDRDELRTQFENKSGYGTIIAESLNSLLALRSYDQTEKDIAYQLQSNMMEIIVNCMDNYSLQDFVEHNITYLEQQLNIQNGNDKSVEILSLMELQYKDYHDDEIKVDQQVFYPVYDYIARMYFEKHLNSNMSYDQAQQVLQNLLDKIMYDVPEEYEIDQAHFTDFLNQYCNEIGISNGYSK